MEQVCELVCGSIDVRLEANASPLPTTLIYYRFILGPLEEVLMVVECPVCERDFTLSENAREGDLVQCPHCKLWFKLVKVNGQLVAARV